MIMHPARTFIAISHCARVLPVVLLLGVLCACTTLTPHGVEPLHQSAEAAYQHGDWLRAVHSYRAYLDKVPADPQGWYRMANAYVQLDRLRQAEAAYYQALNLDPDLAQARHNLALVHMQLAWKELLQARRQLPPDEPAARQTQRYFACLLQTLKGQARPAQCQDGHTLQGE